MQRRQILEWSFDIVELRISNNPNCINLKEDLFNIELVY
jgi:hypothetical protein